MAPQKRAKSKATEEEANNSKHRDIVGSDTRPVEASLPGSHQMGPPLGAAGVSQELYKALQRELADLRHPLETALAAPLWPLPTTRVEAAPLASAIEPLAPLLRGDSNSPLSVGLEMAHWPQGFKMLEVTPFEGCTDPSEFLRAYEITIEAAEGDDTTKVKSVTLALNGVALTWFFITPSPSCSIYAWDELRDLVHNKF
uniref:PH01B001E05.1 protein n=1 Tax=Phyllostachys edulis TaxID=38705 RepID=L0P284_PHYED|nr:PH01B001E05.1 [Phyllostachys edulis]